MLLANPQYLWLLLLLIPIVVWYVMKHARLHAAVHVSSTAPFNGVPRSWKQYAVHFQFVLRILTLATLIIILCRPQTRDSWRTSSTEGTDIILALDISTSMLARDFSPNRFESAKEVASRFVSGRETDNMGVVIFAAESFTGVPMTNDRSLVSNYIHDISMGMLNDGTAIGDGLATSINRIKEGKAKSKSIILLTDGSNNTGNVAPLTAAKIAKKMGIKVYTIGVGTNGTAPYPQQNAFGGIEYVRMPVVIDEATLKNISDMTGGKYFRATDNKVLNNIFNEIDRLEKTRMDVKSFSQTEDDFTLWAAIALALLALQLLIKFTVLRAIP